MHSATCVRRLASPRGASRQIPTGREARLGSGLAG